MEPGALRVEELLRNRRAQRLTTVVNLGEVFYRIAREETKGSAERVLAWLEMLPVQHVVADWTLAKAAATIKSAYPLAYADCFAAALGNQLDAAIVTGDPEFEPLERDGVVRVEWLTRRPKRAR
jgi:ribonuclease VapC